MVTELRERRGGPGGTRREESSWCCTKKHYMDDGDLDCLASTPIRVFGNSK